MTEVAIALGTNLGDRLSQLKHARKVFQSHTASDKWLDSAVYSTAPVNCPPNSPDFYNAVVIFDYAGTPPELLQLCKQLEQDQGRLLDSLSGETNAPRPIDADILYFGDELVNDETLQIPHPRLHLRRFVLVPLADVRASRVLPGMAKSVISTLDALESPEPPLTQVIRFW